MTAQAAVPESIMLSSSQAFKMHVLQRFFQDVHQIERDNYSHRRFSYDGVDRSNVFDIGRHVTFLDWFMSNCDEIYRAYTLLGDDESRRLYVDFIRYRLSGHLHVRINACVASLANEAQRFAESFVGTPSTLGASGMFGTLLHFDQEWNGERYVVDSIKDGLNYLLVFRQYFFERNGLRILPEPGDHVIDGGACLGDSMVVFSKMVGPSGRVYAFDPVQQHVDISRHNAEQQSYRNMQLFGYGLSDRNVEVPPVSLAEYDHGFKSHRMSVPLCRIDDLVIDGRIERIDFIKMDVEGSEMAALRGALASLKAYRPKLAISIYHKPNDLFEICSFLHDQQLGYRFFIDHYTIYDEETVLYAICTERPAKRT